MANAESSNLKLHVGLSSTLNTEPTNYDIVEPTSVSLGPNISTTQSAAIRAGRTPPEQIRTDADGRGDIAQELQAEASDIFIQAAMQSTWGSEANVVPAGAATGSITTAGVLTDDSGLNGFSGVNVGDIFYLEDDDTPANNGGVIVIAKASANVITLTKHNGRLFTAGTSDTITLARNGTISIGATRKFLWIQKFFDNGSGSAIETELFKNASVNTLSVTFTPGQIATLSMNMLGSFPTVASVTQWATATPASGTPFGNKPMNGLDNVRAIVEDIDGTPNVLGDVVTELSMEINNNVATDSVVGQFGAVQSRLGQAIVTGTLNMFLSDTTFINKMLNETATSLAWVVDDHAGGGYGFKLTGLRLTTLGTPVNGPGDVVLQQFGYNATGLKVTRINA